jgi:hypothetical protein
MYLTYTSGNAPDINVSFRGDAIDRGPGARGGRGRAVRVPKSAARQPIAGASADRRRVSRSPARRSTCGYSPGLIIMLADAFLASA